MVTAAATRVQARAPRRTLPRARTWLAAACLLLPLLAPITWSGIRLAVQPDAVLAAVEPTLEAPLSVRSPIGVWALVLNLAWFSLAYRARHAAWWEWALVGLGGAAALVRIGNVWLDALALLAPLAMRLSAVRRPDFRVVAVGLAALVVVSAVLVSSARPPLLATAAIEAAVASSARGSVFADARWAPELQRRLGGGRTVLAAQSVAAESTSFWLDYLRVARGHERWNAILGSYQVGLVVLDAVDREHPAADLARNAADWHVLFDDGQVLVAERGAR